MEILAGAASLWRSSAWSMAGVVAGQEQVRLGAASKGWAATRPTFLSRPRRPANARSQAIRSSHLPMPLPDPGDRRRGWRS